MSLNGNDSESCGTVIQPCRSIAKAIHQAAWEGHIYLDGTGTEREPYRCSLEMAHEQHAGTVVEKSLRMEGWRALPHISCSEGFHFTKTSTTMTSRLLAIALSGISFRQTPLIFQDCEKVTVYNCSFEDTSIALYVEIRNTVRMQLSIQRSSFVMNNISCVEIVLINHVQDQDHFVVVNISETKFMETGRQKRWLARGVVTIQSLTKNPTSPHVQISFLNITSCNNVGYFMNLELPSAVTSEVYNDVRLFNNSLPDLVKTSTGRKTQHAVNSLYNSNARKTRVKFSNLRCSHNHLLRCIKIHSEEAQLEIRNSSFVGQRLSNQRGGAIFLNTTAHGSVVIFNSRFRRNIAKGGGALFSHSKNGTLNLNITNVNFTECASERNGSGCAILVGDQNWPIRENKTGTRKLIAIFREIRMHNCFGLYGLCDGIRLMLFEGEIIIKDSLWENNTQSMIRSLTVVNTGGKIDMTISGCTFVGNIGRNGVVRFFSPYPQAGTVTMVNSVISGQEKTSIMSPAIFASSEFHINLTNIVLTSNFYALVINGSIPNTHSEVYPLHVSLCSCTFLENFRDMVVSAPNPSQVKLAIKNTIFTSRQITPGSFGLFIIVRPLQVLPFSNAVIELDNVTFDSKPCNIIQLLFRGQKTLHIKRSSFLNSFCLGRSGWTYNSSYSVSDISAGAISVVSISDKKLSLGCVRPGPKRDIHPIWQYEAHVRFEDTIFEGNGGLITGAVYICNAYTTFERCRFRNNLAIDNSGHVYSAYGTGQVDFKDCIFSSTKVNMTIGNVTFHKSTFLHSESGGPINLTNTTMVSLSSQRNFYPVLDISNGGYVYMDHTSTIQCPTGSQLLLDNMTHFVYTEHNNSVCIVNVTVLKYSCLRCPQGFYSIQKGVSYGLVLNHTVKCLKCPFGASCIQRNIDAKPNFWGYPISSNPPALTFITCPEHYCKKSTSEIGYNNCQGNRNGTLCGNCTPGYSESLFSTECRMNEECNNYWFWILMILLTTGLALYLLLKPPILVFLGNQILWFREKDENHQENDLGRNDQHSDSGYIKITFYFYQAAEILMVGSIESLLEKTPIIHTVIAAFNFQVRTINKGIGCPFVGLTAVTKQFFLSGTVFVTMADVVLIYSIHSLINMIRRKQKPDLIHYMAVVMEVLLLGYERLAETSLKLMHCVSIESQKWLFIDANVPCIQWWQYFLLAYIVVFVVPFVIVLYCGSSKLYRASINAGEFLAACVLPLPFLVIWFFKKILKLKGQETTTAQTVNKDVLEVLHGPFRPPNNEDKGTLHWESVLIGRRLILLTCQSFITCPMSRMVSMATACLLMSIHHVMKNPYREPMANRAETLSLTTLTMIALINLTKATLLAFGITIDGPHRSYLETLEWFEVISLAFVPVLVSVLVIIAILSQLARLVLFLIKPLFQLGSSQWPMEQRRPLLDISA